MLVWLKHVAWLFPAVLLAPSSGTATFTTALLLHMSSCTNITQQQKLSICPSVFTRGMARCSASTAKQCCKYALLCLVAGRNCLYARRLVLPGQSSCIAEIGWQHADADSPVCFAGSSRSHCVVYLMVEKRFQDARLEYGKLCLVRPWHSPLSCDHAALLSLLHLWQAVIAFIPIALLWLRDPPC